jgi:putative ABC transport system permease protein
LIAAGLHLIGQVAGFFVGGTLFLAAFLFYQSSFLRQRPRGSLTGAGWWSIARLGFRNATYRPGRSILCIALIASASFIIVAVDSFRHREGTDTLERKSGTGGFPLMAESLLPLVQDPSSRAGQEALNLVSDNPDSPLQGVTLTRFRVQPGDDASCLNLYQPRNPKIVAPTGDFLQSSRFSFQSSLAETAEEVANPWLLLNRKFPDGAVPVIADANSLTYVLHLKLGEELDLQHADQPVRLRVVAALADSLFQSELIISEKNFIRVFPEQQGYRFFLIDLPSADRSAAVAATLEDRLADFGFDVQPTSERLASFHRVENTYLSTFQTLGGLGLILGTIGLAAVLLRNVLERRRELALLRAVGYNSRHFTLMIISENALLLIAGVITGTVCAFLAIAPVFLARHGQVSIISLGLLLLAVLVSGLTASVAATWATIRAPLLKALRAE